MAFVHDKDFQTDPEQPLPGSFTDLARRTSASAWNSPWAALAAAVRSLITWQRRMDDRSRLAALDDRLLRDIGLTREQRDHEVAKPFWRG